MKPVLQTKSKRQHSGLGASDWLFGGPHVFTPKTIARSIGIGSRVIMVWDVDILNPDVNHYI